MNKQQLPFCHFCSTGNKNFGPTKQAAFTSLREVTTRCSVGCEMPKRGPGGRKEATEDAEPAIQRFRAAAPMCPHTGASEVPVRMPTRRSRKEIPADEPSTGGAEPQIISQTSKKSKAASTGPATCLASATVLSGSEPAEPPAVGPDTATPGPSKTTSPPPTDPHAAVQASLLSVKGGPSIVETASAATLSLLPPISWPDGQGAARGSVVPIGPQYTDLPYTIHVRHPSIGAKCHFAWRPPLGSTDFALSV